MKDKILNKIMFVKTGWSDLYEGGYVLGNHTYLKQIANIGHEIYNFKRTRNGFCAYIPPSAGSCPLLSGRDAEDWFVVFLARENGNGQLCVVGYYENARIYDKLQIRPEYEYEQFDTDNDGEKFQYCIESKNAFRMPLERRRDWVIRKDLCKHISSTPLVYVKGPKSKDEPWRKDFVDIAERLLNDDDSYVRPFPNVDTATRRRIEIAAVNKVCEYYEERGFHIVDRQKDNCGYDLLVTKGKKEFHVEVKGSSGDRFRLYLTLNEYNHMNATSKWRLAAVKNVFNEGCKLKIFNKDDFEDMFDVRPIEWVAEEKFECE